MTCGSKHGALCVVAENSRDGLGGGSSSSAAVAVAGWRFAGREHAGSRRLQCVISKQARLQVSFGGPPLIMIGCHGYEFVEPQAET